MCFMVLYFMSAGILSRRLRANLRILDSRASSFNIVLVRCVPLIVRATVSFLRCRGATSVSNWCSAEMSAMLLSFRLNGAQRRRSDRGQCVVAADAKLRVEREAPRARLRATRWTSASLRAGSRPDRTLPVIVPGEGCAVNPYRGGQRPGPRSRPLTGRRERGRWHQAAGLAREFAARAAGPGAPGSCSRRPGPPGWRSRRI